MASQQSAITCASPSQPCEQRKSLLRHWLGLFALNAGQPLDVDTLSVYITLWLEGFADLPDAVLEAAFKKTLAACKFWPVKIADVREHVERAEDSRAEDEWQYLLEYVRRHVYPDPLDKTNAPRLPADIFHAACAAGGLRYIESCPTDELHWAKKRFVEDLTRQRKTGDIAGFLPCSELQKMLEAAAPRFALPEPASAAPARRMEHSESFPRPLLRKVERAANLTALVRQGENLWRASHGQAGTGPAECAE